MFASEVCEIGAFFNLFLQVEALCFVFNEDVASSGSSHAFSFWVRERTGEMRTGAGRELYRLRDAVGRQRNNELDAIRMHRTPLHELPASNTCCFGIEKLDPIPSASLGAVELTVSRRKHLVTGPEF